MKKNNTLLLTTLLILVSFSIAIGVGYLIYSSNSEPRPRPVVSNNKGVGVDSKKLKENTQKAKGLIASSNEIVDKIEKFNDLVKIDNTNKITGDFTFDKNNNNHKEYQAYFLDNPIDCIDNKIEEKADNNELIQNTNNYNKVLKSYIEAINLDLIEFLQPVIKMLIK